METKKEDRRVRRTKKLLTQALTQLLQQKQVNEITVKELGDTLYLDSGTLTPLLKKLKNKGYICRNRSRKDERNLLLSVTEEGNALKAYAREITEQIERNTMLAGEDTQALFVLLRKVLEHLDGSKEA